ncbi:MAG: SAM-dependent methyltransferase [Saprospiraceae bacterium]
MEQNNILQKLRESIQEDTFVRLTLSKNRESKSDLRKVLIKLVNIKEQAHLSFVYRHQRKDITKNYELEKAYNELDRLMNETFIIYNLFTTAADWSGELVGTTFKLKKKPPTFKSKPARSHDKSKNHLIGKTNYLQLLGILNTQGNIKKDKGDKYKQINKFVEIIDSLLKDVNTLLEKKKVSVVDMGSGKGYLTFALYDYLKNKLNLEPEITGVEVRPDLIEKCNSIATAVEFDNLKFEEGFINTYDFQKVDVLIALHACDTATDDAIAKGIAAKAQLIVCAPCCHKQIRREIKSSDQLQSVLNHGILKERQAEIITDTIRALLLESKGYKTKVFEFISTEHTGKNLMIVGERHDRKVDQAFYQKEIEKLKSLFEIKEHYLESLLK